MPEQEEQEEAQHATVSLQSWSASTLQSLNALSKSLATTPRNQAGQELIFSALLRHDLQSTLWHLTSYTATQNESAVLLCQALMQAFANCITNNESTAELLWRRMGLDSPEVEGPSKLREVGFVELFMRVTRDETSQCGTPRWIPCANRCSFLSMPNHTAVCSNYKARVYGLALTQQGCALLGTVLRNAAADLQADAQPETSPSDLPDSIAIAYELFSIIFSSGLCGRLLKGFQTTSSTRAPTANELEEEDPPLNARQVALLQMFDAYLVHGSSSGACSDSSPDSQSVESASDDAVQDSQSDLVYLVSSFATLSAYTVGLMRRLSDPAESVSAQDEAISRGDRFQDKSSQILETVSKEESVRTVVELLHSTSKFSPAISPFQNIVASNHSVASAPEGHVLTSTGQSRSTFVEQTEQADRGGGGGGGGGLQNLKRDLVRLLGVMSFVEPASSASARKTEQDRTAREARLSRVKRVQDAVRESGGLLDVLNMTQLDENNPWQPGFASPHRPASAAEPFTVAVLRFSKQFKLSMHHGSHK
ncbi:hypothetical protein IE81DRAFT_341678 [Ceraceosorus guamensis]|uniref:Ataxin-10 domain-containing protein n=1 Tax=Ceraceosorus guamensis TaxID=1522189 RepID=A0A316VXB2_9BASI|nr:hypothetical protein IE81DRAFT_341678 [Ceraceosorus guamensis]PWN42092.1 hypothetical protein IE81DRAFT_341678 [Ceraceosorus guamensis]